MSALRAQNVQVSAGVLNQPPISGTAAYQINVEALGRLTIPDQFADIIVKSDNQGRVTRIRDIALWSYKIHFSERFDLLGNSLAIISGVVTRSRARRIILWIEHQCDILRAGGELVGELPPNFFPYITPQDPDWRSRYKTYNRPGEYHNGGVWPFILGFYVAAIVAAGFPRLAGRKLAALTEFVRNARNSSLAFGFNEWVRASDGAACGEDWQSWSAAMYLFAAACVEQKRVLLF